MARADKTAAQPDIQPIKASVEAYEGWMRAQLGERLVASDLDRKHEKMRESAFVFLRATYWRWAEAIPRVCPDLADGPSVLAVGDLHVENFGTWRDAEGRLVWGVNDFDETAEMPYALDLTRLAASALLAGKGEAGARTTCEAILEGYRQALEKPNAVVLERDWQWLRQLVSVSEEARAKFWKKLETGLDGGKRDAIPQEFSRALADAMPDPKLAFVTMRRTAGAGSLGRPRWVGYAEWNGAPALREVKALLPSAWSLARGESGLPLRCGEAATGPFRSPDPWYQVKDALVVRRLSPNNRKLDAEKELVPLLSKEMLSAMGAETGNIHAAARDTAKLILRDLQRREEGWLATAAKAAAKATERDYREWAGK